MGEKMSMLPEHMAKQCGVSQPVGGKKAGEVTGPPENPKLNLGETKPNRFRGGERREDD